MQLKNESQKELTENGYMLCPHCGGDMFDTDGTETDYKHMWFILICRKCGESFSVKYSNPEFVTLEQMYRDLG